MIDVDGTLVDSVPDLAYCVDEMMIALGKPPIGNERVRPVSYTQLTLPTSDLV